MEIGIFTNEFCCFGEKRYQKICEAGFKYADFCMSNTEDAVYSYDEAEFIKCLKEEARLAREANITINQMHGPWRWPPQDSTAEDRRERLDKMKKSIIAASVLGCKNWVVHPIMPFGIYDKGTENEGATWRMNIEFMRELLVTAKKYDVIICVENMPMPQFSIASPEDVLKLVKIIDDDNFRICFDTGHAAICTGSEIGNEIRKLGKNVRVLHIHDNDGNSDQHRMPFYGIINWQDFVKSLKDIGFDGVFSLETGPSRKLPEEIFDKMAKLLCETAKTITDNQIGG